MLNKIILHWSAGTNYPNATDLEHYHFLVDRDGKVHTGKFTPEDNIDCTDGKYAAHTGGGNTGSIGIALCAMAGYKDIKNIGNYPIQPVQIEAAYRLMAQLCKKYKIPVTKETLMTHYEFGKKNPHTSSAGKIDIVYLSTNPNIVSGKIGEHIRGKVNWYLDRGNLQKL